MTARTRALRTGPQSASLSRALSMGRSGATLSVLVEAWGAGADRDSIQSTTAQLIGDRIERASGSATARIRAALLAAHHHIRDVQHERPDLAVLGAGASVLVVVDDRMILAQAGPSLAFRQGPDAVEQAPETSPWLQEGLTALSDETVWPPLGLGSDLAVHWSHWPATPGTSVLLVPSVASSTMIGRVAEALLATAPDGMKAAIGATLGDRMPAIHVALTQEASAGSAAARVSEDANRAAPDADSETPHGPTAPDADPAIDASRETGPTAHVSDVDLWRSTADIGETAPAVPETPIAAVTNDEPRLANDGGASRSMRNVSGVLRLATIRGARQSARVLRSMLPQRSEEGAYRRERIRLVAAACIVLPLLIIALALAVRAMGDVTPLPSAPAVSGDEAEGAQATVETSDPGTVRLTSPTAVALPGSADDERHLVAVHGEPYVMNVAQGRVDLVADGSPRPVMVRGQVVGGDTVADLNDLFWLPNESGTDGRVVALDAAGRLWSVSGDQAVRVPSSDQPAWFSVSRAAGYGGSMYVLDRSPGHILRYAGDEARFPSLSNPGTQWLAEPAALRDAVDLAIDGSIFVLDGDGSMRRFAQGSLDEAAVFDERTRSGDVRAVYTSPTAGRLLVADRAGGRVLVLDPVGSYVGQILQQGQALSADEGARNGRFGALQDVWWDEADGMLFLIDGNLLLQAPYR